MESWLGNLFFDQWQRKVLAIVTACAIWFAVNHSITSTRSFTNVPIRVVDLPSGRTMDNLLPNGRYSETITLTLQGDRDILDEIEPADLEVVISAAGKPDHWTPNITPGELHYKNPNLDLAHDISKVTYPEFVLHLSRRVTAKIPVVIQAPIHRAPPGYQFLDVFPKQLFHKVSGPEEWVEELKHEGLTLTFDLSEISSDELDQLVNAEKNGDDEVSFAVPSAWKVVAIPFLNDELQMITDPEARNLKINFLRTEALPIDWEVPVRLFFPPKFGEQLNPDNLKLMMGTNVADKFGISVLKIPLFAGNVSRLFLETVRDRIEVTVIVDPERKDKGYLWTVQFIDPSQLEQFYVHRSMQDTILFKGNYFVREEELLRERFRTYVQRFQLSDANGQPIKMEVRNGGKGLVSIDKQSPSESAIVSD